MTVQSIPIPASSHIAAVSYDAETQELEVTFQDGAVYIYGAVPEGVARGFSSALSAGKYFNAQIKDRFDFSEA